MWNATGEVEGRAGDWSESLTFRPPEDELGEGAARQLAFARETIDRAFAGGVIDGRYSLSAGGHDDDRGREDDRRSFSISLWPILTAAG